MLLIERDVQGLVAETALLESMGLRVQTAADADEALETLQEEANAALVLLATLMSAENTCDTIRAIRSNEQFRELQIVVMGAPAGCAGAGRDSLTQAPMAFVTKPVNTGRDRGAAEREASGIPGAETAADGMNRYTGFKLLIVDDHEHNLFTLRTLVEKHMDVAILEATSGRQALDITLQQPDIDLIILDVQMPEMDGFQTASMLKIRKNTRDIPIIFLTAAFKIRGVPAEGLRGRRGGLPAQAHRRQPAHQQDQHLFPADREGAWPEPDTGAKGRGAHRRARAGQAVSWRT